MLRYAGQERLLVAVDCIVFGFDKSGFKLLLVKRDFAPEKQKWSLMGGFLQLNENLDEAASRVLEQLTGLKDVFMEQMKTFGHPRRDPVERTVGVAYVALIDIHQYEQQIREDFHAKWFKLEDVPKLIFDHGQMVKEAKNWLRYKASLHPVLFELLPEKFTLQQLHALYEELFQIGLDRRNFARKVLATGIMVKLKEKEKLSSRKGAFFYTLDKEKYKEGFHTFLNFISKPGNLLQ